MHNLPSRDYCEIRVREDSKFCESWARGYKSWGQGWSFIVIILRFRGVLNHSRDGFGHRVRGIASRSIFESLFDARDPRNPQEDRGSPGVTQTTSSTLLQCRRRGWAPGGMTKVLTCGSLTRPSAFLSCVVVLSSSHTPISSVCRFGRDLRHSTNKGEMGPVRSQERYTVMILHRRGRISLSLRTKKGTGVLHAGSQKRVRAQSIQYDDIEPPSILSPGE